MAQPTQQELLSGITERLTAILKQPDPIPLFMDLVERAKIDLRDHGQVDFEDYVIQQLIKENRDNSLDFYWFRFKMDFKNQSFLESLKDQNNAA